MSNVAQWIKAILEFGLSFQDGTTLNKPAGWFVSFVAKNGVEFPF